ncbi:response regulator transcription factor [Xanthomonas sp. NCPPB 2654]|uniref:response regulator transcription factor n=1 Tax=unclassified Xanthomonas TaxID=2643310 RepID=UPI0021E0439D|nr:MULTISPECIES: response regulator transcription factor [unclassified Xanthomonas]MDL5365445.1 response regulator transcription factor [Xanthomonas sp. NCPPB 2654]UYC20109.1 response regulator transcription factor [Xanthomonas sp. CFBP 8443]
MTASPGLVLAGVRIAVVEDDPELRAIVVDELRHEGAQVLGFGSAEALYRHLLGDVCDLVVLDVGLPGEDGYSVARYLRQIVPQAGIVMLTGRGANTDMTRGLMQGADLYLVKPLDVELLIAALANLRRRLQPAAPSAAPTVQDWRLSDDGWTLFAPGARTLALTEAERGLLKTLFAQRGAPVDRDTLIAAVTDAPWDFDPHRLEVLVHRLRARVTAATAATLPLRAVRGQGYLLGEAA